jgi:hypothetical protein
VILGVAYRAWGGHRLIIPGCVDSE